MHFKQKLAYTALGGILVMVGMTTATLLTHRHRRRTGRYDNHGIQRNKVS